ncbi:RNB domain-containing ribonuclease [Polynucleobacter sp. MG-27-Goln-C1]|uniref:RNB domain-containing ribonuclease n=1 Tax=Polynucleobacter sp. MG-27-Goln-C1 TaxID=1819726 RepID=UPI001C0C60DB|nr:RNB domain-containing ribonuclease [Polynucleobacter sp. MG-27-Goln-C1]MBU3613242.1 RNB domain-containing ribonuclease [Polynucleobacter sp. MG-27-Goln-C1]
MKISLKNQHTPNQREELDRIAVGVMIIRGLEPNFSSKVDEQLKEFTGPARDTGAFYRDLSNLLWCSIDNDDSRDLDQITVTEQMPDGGIKLYVAIADVDALVKMDSPVDDHAFINTRSVYTSARIFPMLPTKLSNDLTSLNPHEDRLAMVCEMHFSKHAEMLSSSIYMAKVRNQSQLAYDAVSAWLEDKGPMPDGVKRISGLESQLKAQDELAQKLRVLRHEKGSLEFDIFQPRASFVNDEIAEISQQAHNRARQLIEEFMIATNGCTSRFLAEAGIYSMRRVVRSPERWLRIVQVAADRGYKLPKEPDSQALEVFLAKEHRSDPVRFPDLSLIIVKLMGSGEYIVEKPKGHAVGHFGLAVSDYMHSTAPNRRYPDLITLRLIKSVLFGQKPPYSTDELKALALHCTIQEDVSKRVERQVRKSEAALLLSSRIGQYFDGIVSGANEKDTWVRIFNPPVEGKLVHSSKDLTVGHLVRVKLIYTHVERGFIDFVVTG